jgi:hypothetical protein
LSVNQVDPQNNVIIQVDNFEKMSNVNISEIEDLPGSSGIDEDTPGAYQKMLPAPGKFKKAVKVSTKE